MNKSELKQTFQDFMKFWDEVTEKQGIIQNVNMRQSKILLEQVISKYLEKKSKEEE